MFIPAISKIHVHFLSILNKRLKLEFYLQVLADTEIQYKTQLIKQLDN